MWRCLASGGSTSSTSPQSCSKIFLVTKPANSPPARVTGMKANFMSVALGDPPEQEAEDERPADRERQRVALGHRARLVRAARRGRADALLDFVDLLAGLALDVGLLPERLDGVAELEPRALDVAAQLLRAPGLAAVGGRLYCRAAFARSFVHWTSSFTLSTVCSGTGGVACWTFPLPVSASTPAIAAYTTQTISAASQPAIASLRARIRQAVNAPNA